jgi:hypothetical protein
MSSLIFCLILLLMLHIVYFMDLTIIHMILVHKRIALFLDALVKAHILIVAIILHVGTVFLPEYLTLVLSQDTWMVHVFPVVVQAPLVQIVRCKRL